MGHKVNLSTYYYKKTEIDEKFVTTNDLTEELAKKVNIANHMVFQNVVTDNNGNITTEAKPTIPTASASTPIVDSQNGAIGVSDKWAKADHQHPQSSIYATSSHSHGVIDSNGKIIGQINKNVVTNSSGEITTEPYYNIEDIEDIIDLLSTLLS